MKTIYTAVLLLSIVTVGSCDFRSGTAKEEMEKFSGTPTPTITPTPTQEPVDPADIVQVDTAQEGATLNVSNSTQNKTVTCSKFDKVMVNSSGSEVTINGACRQIMVNGNSNQIKADAAMEFIFNGTGNTLKYSRFVNGKRPAITENQSGNNIEKAAFEPDKRPQATGKKK
jgi:hypothetical protein